MFSEKYPLWGNEVRSRRQIDYEAVGLVKHYIVSIDALLTWRLQTKWLISSNW